MAGWHWWHRAATTILTAVALAVTVLVTGAFGAAPVASAATPICTSASNPTLAARMSEAIKAAAKGRTSRIGIHFDDPSLNLRCSLNSAEQFYAGSTVKAIILAALLRKADDHNRSLTSKERSEAWSMITVSNNYAAGYLWYDVGRKALHHFLSLAGMNGTILGPGAYWGLTEETAYDESLLLHLLVTDNSVLTKSDRDYELQLMANVIPSQRWGTPAGVPPGYTVHVKNGWITEHGYGWIINSLGAFTERGRDYTLDVLTDHNATKAYGVTTIEKIAVAVNHDLASQSGSTAAATAWLPSSARPASCEPDEVMPASAFRSTRARPVTTPMPMSPPATPQPFAAETSGQKLITATGSRLTAVSSEHLQPSLLFWGVRFTKPVAQDIASGHAR